MLQGNELIDSQLELKFRTDVPKRDICSMTLDDDAVGEGPLSGAALRVAEQKARRVCAAAAPRTC